jgi:hypothetical protein
MRAFLLISCAALGVAACGGGNEAEDANMATDANMMMEENIALDGGMNADANMGMDANMGGTGTDNMAAADMATNTPDTNVANGL